MMKTNKKLITLLVVIAVSLFFTGSVLASDGNAPLFDDEVVFFGTFSLESGETLQGNLIVFGGVVSLEEDSEITGDVLVFGGNVTASGTIGNNLVAIGGVVRLRGTAIVEGDLIAPATVVRRDEEAKIYGQIITENIPEIEVPEIEGPEIEIPELPVAPERPSVEPTFFDRLSKALDPVVSFFSVIARALIFSAIAVLVGLVVPKNSTLVRETIEEQPVLSGGFGLLSVGVFVAAIIMLALLSITVILIPLTVSLIVLLSLAFAIGLVYGLITVGGEFGRRIMVAVKQDWTPTLQTAIGAFSMAFLLGLLSYGLWGILGSLLWTMTGAIGLGAVLLTRFGTQRYVPTAKRKGAGKPAEEETSGGDKLIEDIVALANEDADAEAEAETMADAEAEAESDPDEAAPEEDSPGDEDPGKDSE